MGLVYKYTPFYKKVHTYFVGGKKDGYAPFMKITVICQKETEAQKCDSVLFYIDREKTFYYNGCRYKNEEVFYMNILAIGAHPDDIETSCGGTLAKYAKQKGIKP